jgi:hypothetical protein
MKALVTAVMLAFATFAVHAAEPAKKAETKQETKCVKKDKNGKCPPAPKGDKPTPKKKVETK